LSPFFVADRRFFGLRRRCLLFRGQTLAAELQADSITPWLCEVDVELGDNFVAKIEEGLREADLTVLFWSPEAARSAWTHLEWTLVTAREISESRTRLGLVLLRDCAVPELLRVKHRIASLILFQRQREGCGSSDCVTRCTTWPNSCAVQSLPGPSASAGYFMLWLVCPWRHESFCSVERRGGERRQ
jgi:hypothetical protein